MTDYAARLQVDTQALSLGSVPICPAKVEPNQFALVALDYQRKNLFQTATKLTHPQVIAEMAARVADEKSATNFLVLVDVDQKMVGVFTRLSNQEPWELTRLMRCSVGAPDSPTPKGTYTVKNRGDSFVNSFGTCYYYVQFEGDYCFHSTPVNSQGEADNRMGCEVSHGCVRLLQIDAKWVFDHVLDQTKVIIY